MYINKPSVTKIEEVDRVNLLHNTSCIPAFLEYHKNCGGGDTTGIICLEF